MVVVSVQEYFQLHIYSLSAGNEFLRWRLVSHYEGLDSDFYPLSDPVCHCPRA